MFKYGKLLAVAGVVAAAGSLFGPLSAQAGTPPSLTVEFDLHLANADEVLAGIDVEVYTDVEPPVDVTAESACNRGAQSGDIVDATRDDTCTSLEFGDYILGLTGVPDGVAYDVDCFSEQGPAFVPQAVLEPSDSVNPYFTTEFGPATCFVSIQTTILAVDKVVEGGPATPPPFPVAVAQGATQLATGADPAPNVFCDADLADCALLNVDPDFASEEPVGLTEAPPAGYALAGIECDHFIGDLAGTLDGSGIGDSDGDGTDLGFDGDIYCVVTNQWIGGTLDVDASVTNDNGGVAGVTDVQVEVYDAADALILGPTACAADGNCLNVELPPGDYTIGYAGPAGYTRSITQTVTNPLLTTQAIVTDDPDAEFAIVTGGVVEIDVAIDDPTPATTTTTSTTTTTTTIAVAPALPETGTSGAANAQIAAIATAMVLLGGTLVVGVGRRRS